MPFYTLLAPLKLQKHQLNLVESFTDDEEFHTKLEEPEVEETQYKTSYVKLKSVQNKLAQIL